MLTAKRLIPYPGFTFKHAKFNMSTALLNEPATLSTALLNEPAALSAALRCLQRFTRPLANGGLT